MKLKKAIFLDRDGVINKERGEYTYKIKDFVLNVGVIEALQQFTEEKYLLIIITNQSGIAKGIYTHSDVKKLHEYMLELFRVKGINITAIYYCPHHPDIGKCLCRKPGSLLIEKTIARFNIDPKQSYFIGDKDRDIVAGKAAGVRGILIPANSPILNALCKTHPLPLSERGIEHSDS